MRNNILMMKSLSPFINKSDISLELEIYDYKSPLRII